MNEEKRISEAASKNTGKRGRGRPPIMDAAAVAQIEKFFPHIKTRRGMQDLEYRTFAVFALKDDARFIWVMGEKGTNGKPAILSELGRCFLPNTIQTAALKICELKPKTKDAVTLIRSWRTGKTPEWNPFDLGNHIISTINEYKRRHSEMPWSDVENVLRVVLGHIQKEHEEPEGNP